MPLAFGFAVLLAGAALAVWHLDREVAGLAPAQAAALAGAGAAALLVASAIVDEFRGRFMSGVRALLVWALIIVGLVGLYAYRFELEEVATRIAGEFSPATTTVTPAGELVVTRRGDGTFIVPGRVNDRELRFIFDTGASTVVLTAQAAEKIGLSLAPTDFVVPVYTANGRTVAAPVVLDEVRVGPIAATKVRALVARPGALRENLLGMTFLDRLASYEVRQNRLILRGRQG
ncbi:MAG TPA: TIGR02281 family clan AA aspartic protease [Beijerinckiaceae bacterium]|nr:TIGR02281 family clan AA aspartic protease [Beijerinckiaceae bacterium]